VSVREGGSRTLCGICDGCARSSQLAKARGCKYCLGEYLPISTAPALDPAMIDRNALGYSIEAVSDILANVSVHSQPSV
jgi:hypothetical protein